MLKTLLLATVPLLTLQQFELVTAVPGYCSRPRATLLHTVYGPDQTRSVKDSPEPLPGAVESWMRCLFSRSNNWRAAHVARDCLEITALLSARRLPLVLP